VTPQTIRRDINALSAGAVLRRYHGGAGLPSSVENLAYPTRQVLCLEEKRRIARLVAAHVPDEASLFVNIGTTTEEVAKALLDHHRGLRVITNNLNVAAMLAGKADFQVTVAGGVVRSRDRGIVGEATVDLIRQFRVDFGIIGISGVDLDGTLLDFDYQEVRVAQAIIASSRRSTSPPTTPSSGAAPWSGSATCATSTRCSPTASRLSPCASCWLRRTGGCSWPRRRRLASLPSLHLRK
jgi:DeoR family glycerol-3-phosphate regulon repressor